MTKEIKEQLKAKSASLGAQPSLLQHRTNTALLITGAPGIHCCEAEDGR